MADTDVHVLDPHGAQGAAGDAISRPPAADEHSRVRLGATASTPASILMQLAADHSIAVRAAVAMNPATPAHVQAQLTQDGDERVRLVLARRLAALTPGLPSAEQSALAREVWDTLTLLVRDEFDRVRAAITEMVHDLPAAPRALILTLAQDAAACISAPVLQLSPILTEEDLLALLAGAAAPHVADSIAHRTDLTGAICDAIARTADTVAIRSLLINPSAAIRETTLDALTARAAPHQDWHEPLVRRPALSAHCAKLLASFVSEHLICVLAGRPDLDPAVVANLSQQLARRLAGPDPLASSEPAWLADARRRIAAGTFGDACLIDPLRGGDSEQIVALIALGANVPPEVVRRAGRLRSAKAIVSLIWKAGLSMRIAPPVQAMLCNLAPNAMLRAPAEGGFPLSEEEMRWQVAFVARSVD